MYYPRQGRSHYQISCCDVVGGFACDHRGHRVNIDPGHDHLDLNTTPSACPLSLRPDSYILHPPPMHRL
jgi:hypothetical protein